MVCALWQAPIPWWHAHSQDSAVNHDAARILQRHVEAYHACEVLEVRHVHFVLLADVARGAGTPVPCGDDEPDLNSTWVLIPRSVEEADATRITAPLDLQPVAGAQLAVAARPSGSANRLRVQFLTDFAQGQRLLPLLGIALC
jgi:hypothetical protein